MLNTENESEFSYSKTFKAKDGNIYGIRLATPNSSDALFIKEIFKDIYGWDYLYPIVYDIESLNMSFVEPKNNWTIVEDIHSKEGAAIGLFERPNKFKIHMGKLCVKNKFHGIGISSILGGHIITHLMLVPESKSLLRFDCDVRANIIYSQKFLEKARAIPYGFIANYNNYADKRKYNIKSSIPFIEGELGSVIMSAINLSRLWKIREKDLSLLDDERILSIYQIIRRFNRQMKKDNITVEKTNESHKETFTLSKDFYKGIIKIEGYLRDNTIKQILREYSNWNVIEWKVPANNLGIISQKNALNNGFIASGYDPGSFYHKTLQDTILFCKYPRGIEYTQFNDLDLTPRSKLIVDSIMSNLEENKIKKLNQKKQYEVKIECFKS